jgi:hypothetical protein
MRNDAGDAPAADFADPHRRIATLHPTASLHRKPRNGFMILRRHDALEHEPEKRKAAFEKDHALKPDSV